MNMKLNKNLKLIEESATLRLNALAKQIASGGTTVVNLTAGELDFETPKEIAREVARYLHLNKYTPSLGMLELRRGIAESLNKKYGLKLGERNIAVTAGAKQGLFLACQALLNAGDEVIIPVPYWVSYAHQVRLCGARPVFVALTKNFDLGVTAVKKAVTKKTKAIILNSPHNPTGAVFNPAKVKQLLSFAAKRGIFVIADEIYGKLTYGKPFISVLKMKPDFSRLILVDGFSKSHALTGWRIGYAVADERIIASFNKILGHTAGNASVISQRAALACLAHPEIPRRFAAILKDRRALAVSLIKKIPGLRLVPPQGAFYLFLDVRKITKNSEQLAERLLADAGLAVVPGEAFGEPGFLRISFAASKSEIRRGLALLRRFIKKSGILRT